MPQARDRLVELCACHPYLIQSLCNRVFEQAATGSDRTITVEIVEQAAAEMVLDNEHLQTLWGYVGSERRRLVLELCDHLAAGADAVNVDLLSRKFLEHAYGFDTQRTSPTISPSSASRSWWTSTNRIVAGRTGSRLR